MPTSAASYRRILGANERVPVGMVGLGGMARGHLNNLLNLPDEAQVVALCDVFQPHLARAAERAPEAATYTDFRRVLDRSDIDAVVVATPDHWHAAVTAMACEAGKDVYVEKPTSHNIVEGRKMVETAHRTGRIVQAGTQQRSGRIYHHAKALVEEGRLGEVKMIRTWNHSNAAPDGIGNPSDEAPPEELNWDLWLGPAPRVAYNPNRFRSFRQFWDYAGGRMTDWGTHHIDIVHWIMGVDAPETVASSGGKLAISDNREAPDTQQATFHYPGFVCMYETRYGNGHEIYDSEYGMLFYGTAGTLFLTRSRLELMPVDGTEPTETDEAPHSSHAQHMQGFLEATRTRKPPISEIESGHRSSSACILANISYRVGRKLTWDRAREQVVGDPEAAQLLGRDYRAPWSI